MLTEHSLRCSLPPPQTQLIRSKAGSREKRQPAFLSPECRQQWRSLPTLHIHSSPLGTALLSDCQKMDRAESLKF